MDRNEERVTRAQRRHMDPDASVQEDQVQEAPRRRRSQAARIRDNYDDMRDTIVPPSKETLEEKSRYARPEPGAATPGRSRRGVPEDDPYEDRDDYDQYSGNTTVYSTYDIEDDGPPEKRHVIRWVVIVLVVLALLAGATYVGLSRPDLIEPVVQWGRELIYGPTPSPAPTPTITPEPEPTPTPMPDASTAVVVDFLAYPMIQPDLEAGTTFQVTTTLQTTKIQMVDENGRMLFESQPGEYTDMNNGRVFNFKYYFSEPYEGNVLVSPGNDAGWNDEKGSVIAIVVGEVDAAEPTKAPDQDPALSSGSVPEIVPASAVVSTLEATSVEVDEQIIIKSEVQDFFVRESAIRMGGPEEYNMKSGRVGATGVMTFRGSNMRQNSATGTVLAEESKLESLWTANAGTSGDASSFWSKQPVIVQWAKNVRESMALLEGKAEKAALKEVIFAGSDGKLYFFDLDDGTKTRDEFANEAARTMLGTPSIYPLGVPLVFVGTGEAGDEAEASGDIYMYAYNLFNHKMSGMIRGQNNSAPSDNETFITAPLFDNNTDVAMFADGNGLLYTINLNTEITAEEGYLSVRPSPELYSGTVEGSDASVSSALAGYGEYVYYASEGGVLQCVNINTLANIWALDLGADTKGALALEDDYTGNDVALYVASMPDAEGVSHIRRINGATGYVQWDVPIASAIDTSPLVGTDGLSRYVFFTTTERPTLFALDKDTGEFAWEFPMDGTRGSTPIAVYTEDGQGYIIQGDSGKVHLLDGFTGELLDTLTIEGSVIGSPAAYDDIIVVATDNGKLHGIRLK